MEMLKNPHAFRRILLVGEGNFSFSKAVVPTWQLENSDILVTCYEKEPNENARNNMNTLSALENVQIRTGFDATAMDVCDIGRFDLIIFMFPHIGGKMKINRNRDLLKRFAISTEDILNENGQVLVTLCDGQGGTPYDQCQRKPSDSWQIVKMMSFGHLGLVQLDRFQQIPDYSPFGYRSQDKGFNTVNGVIHVFQRHNKGLQFLHPDTHWHDLSFWLPSDQGKMKDFQAIIKEVSDDIVTKIELLDSYFVEDENERRNSQTFRLTFCSFYKVLSPDDILKLHYKIGNILTARINIQVR